MANSYYLWYPQSESEGNGGKDAFNYQDSLFPSVPNLVLDWVVWVGKKKVAEIVYGSIRLHS